MAYYKSGQIYATQNSNVAIQTASGSIASFETPLQMPIVGCKININPVQSGIGTPTPDNPLPISGRTSIEITKTGKNLLGGSKLLANAQAHLPNGTTDTEAKTFLFYANETPPVDTSFSKGLTFKDTTKYSLLFTVKKSSSSGSNIRVRYRDGVNTNLSVSSSDKEMIVHETVSSKTLYDIRKYSGSGSTTLYYEESGVFEGYAYAEDFEAYKGETKTISLGQTVYGGTLDLLTGKLIIDYNIVTLTGGEDENWNIYSNGNGFYLVISDMPTGAHMSGWCDRFIVGEDKDTMCIILGATTLNNRAYFAQANDIDGVNSLATWKEWLSNNNVQLVYPRKKPITVTLTPETFKTFVGTNNFYADCGDVEVKYKNIITGG